MPRLTRLARQPDGALTWRVQTLIVLALAVVGVVAALLLRAVTATATAEPAPNSAPRAPAADGFRPTPAQMASLTFAPVVATVFRAERVTDGRIAHDGDRTTPVFPPFTGRVTRILVKPGDRVERGAPLLTIEAPEFAQAQNDYVSAQAALDTARSQLTLAQVSEQRKYALYDAKAGALQDWQQSQAELVSAQSALRAAQTALALAHNRLRILGASEGQLHSLEQAQKVEALATVTAPIAGVITDRQVGLGQYLQAGASTPVFSIGDLSRVWLVANVREADAPLMHRGAEVEVRVLALPDRVFKATITYVAPSIDPNTHRLAVRAEVSNPDELLKPEMFATFTILTGREATAPGVPEQAVVYEGEHARVWVARPDGSIVSREIKTGRTASGMVEVLAGLQPGEKVVSGGTLFIDRAARAD